MTGRKGFTLIEVLVTLFIAGIIVAIALPNLMVSIEQSKAQTAQNNLLAISAAESKYNEDYGKYCLAGCADNKGLISQNLSVTFSADDPFTYNCAAGSLPFPFTCTASDSVVTLNLNPNTNPTVACTPPGGSCPSQ